MQRKFRQQKGKAQSAFAAPWARLRLLRRGFTLVELMVAVAVIGIIAAILFSVISNSREGARRAVCDVHLKSIALALDAFKQEQGSYPEELQELVDRKYITEPELLSCPDDPRPSPSYEDFYIVRGPRDNTDLPILVCPFHDKKNHGLQAYTGRYTTQLMTSPAELTSAVGVTVEHPGKNPVAAPVGLKLHGADRLRTSGGGTATITFADGTTANVRQNTEMVVLQSFVANKTKGRLYTVVRQAAGSVRYNIHHGSKFDIATPTATAGALGTNFELRVTPKEGTWLNVEEGKVRFNTLSGEPAEEVQNGVWISAPPPEPPPPPPPAPHRPPPRRPRPGGTPPLND